MNIESTAPALRDDAPGRVASRALRENGAACEIWRRWRGRRIVFLSHSDFGRYFAVGSHHLAREIAAGGCEVLHVAMPVSFAHAVCSWRAPTRRRVVKSLRGPAQLEERLWEWVPFGAIPYSLARSRPGLLGRWILPPRLDLPRAAAGFARPDLVIIDEPRLFGMIDVLRPNAVIYRPTDIYDAFRDDPAVRMWERCAVERSDICVATSNPVADKIESRHRMRVSGVIENGVTVPADVSSRLARARERNKAVYIGAIDHRFDAAAVIRLAEGMDDWRFECFGPNGGVQLPSHPRVNWRGALPHAQLWDELLRADIAILPMNAHPSNEGRSPMKIYEYLAAGLPVVARRTAELARRRIPGVHLYDEGGEVAAFHDACDSAARRERFPLHAIALRHSWKAKAAQLLNFAERIGH